jgi:putative ABC transport system substrate-binding protein
MRRRQFLTLLGVAAVLPFASSAQQPAGPVVGILSGASPETFAPLEVSFRRGLAEAGFVEGRTLAFEYRWAQGQFDLLT